jgi:hypothetical protein
MAVVILALHRAKTAYWKKAQSVKRFTTLNFKKGRAHSDSKLVYLDMAQLSRNEVTKLV